MTTPTQPLYASIADLRLVLDSTDAGLGTGAQLSDEQLTLALQAGTDRVTTYAGTIYDPTPGTGNMPGLVRDLTLDISAWYATTYYLKHKGMDSNHPVVLRYAEAVKVLDQVRQGLVALDVATEAAASARIINRIPNIFTGEDSNTTVQNDDLLVSTPADMWSRPAIINNRWIEYTG
jgi:phage gp36-like protein